MTVTDRASTPPSTGATPVVPVPPVLVMSTFEMKVPPVILINPVAVPV